MRQHGREFLLTPIRANDPNGIQVYTDSMDRHRLREGMREFDPEDGEIEATKTAPNALIGLELILRRVQSDAAS